MNYSRSAIDVHLVRVDTGNVLKRPLYILPEEYRGERQTFQSDVGIRCGGIGLSKISQNARAQTAGTFRSGNVVTRRIYTDKVSQSCTHSAKLLTLFSSLNASLFDLLSICKPTS